VTPSGRVRRAGAGLVIDSLPAFGHANTSATAPSLGGAVLPVRSPFAETAMVIANGTTLVLPIPLITGASGV